LPPRASSNYGAAMRAFGTPPSADEIEVIARAPLERLPEPFARSVGDIVLLVRNFADDATLASMGIDNPFDLSGLYEGIPLTERSVEHSGTLPERIFLYRRPILDEWAEGEETLEHLVAHVLIHEVGHHFGLSDDDIHALEDAVE
jgi:predicted Zn-dependent protease with MMP-like domain